MESSNDASENFQFSTEDLEQIPCPDSSPHLEEISRTKTQFIPPLSTDDLELPPLPPHLFNRKFSKSFSDSSANESSHLNCSNNFNPPLPADLNKNIDTSQIPLPENYDHQLNNILLPQSTPFFPLYTNSKNNECEQEENIVTKNYDDDNKYSPSKVESDEENQDFASAKPKVLGKEQAKKRLMAFSLSKLPSATTKKQNKITNSLKTIKEKPPNPNKSSGVQDQFRATISEIEEEKRKMMKNMPSYLLLEMNDLVKTSNVVIKPSISSDKNKNENSDISSKDCSTSKSNLNKAKEHSKNKEKKSSQRGRSRSRNKSRSRSRSRSRNKKRRKSRSLSKTRRRSKSVDNPYVKLGKLPEDWKSLKKTGFEIDVFLNAKFDIAETEKISYENQKRYSKEKLDFKPNFNYLKTNSKIMRYFRAKPIDSQVKDSNLYSEKTIKFTTAKPMIMWSENPSCATDFYMPKNMLLENCDQSSTSILHYIINGKNENSKSYDTNQIEHQKSRAWYTSNDFFVSTHFNLNENAKRNSQNDKNCTNENEYNLNSMYVGGKEKKQNIKNSEKDFKDRIREGSKKKGSNNSVEKQVCLVNDSYLSDDESNYSKIKEMIVGDVKVHVDFDLNSVKVPSKWDSDYENENVEKHLASSKEIDMDIASLDEEASICSATTTTKLLPNEFLNYTETSLKENSVRSKNSDNINLKSEKEDLTFFKPLDAKTENLASEYEEFLKMVSFDSSYNTPTSVEVKPSENVLKSEKQKNIDSVNSETNSKKTKVEITDWDRESDHEEISPIKLSKKNIESSSIFTVNEEEITHFKKELKKKVAPKKKVKAKKNKQIKKRSKTKKKKYNTSSSSDSNSDSYDSESDSESDKSKSRKKRKVSKSVKKSKKYSSSESDSDSDSSISSKDQIKKKVVEKKKKNKLNCNNKVQNVLLKELDLKKQLIIKKIEAIDSIGEKNEEKRNKSKRQKENEYKNSTSDESDSQDKKDKSDKKKIVYSKSSSNRKKSKNLSKAWSDKKEFTTESSTSSDSEIEYSTSKLKKKKTKKTGRKKRSTSESSLSEEKFDKSKITLNKMDKLMDVGKFMDVEKNIKKIKKNKRQRKKSYSSSDSEDISSKGKKKQKKSKNKISEEIEERKNVKETAWQKDNFLFEGNFKDESNRAHWDDIKLREDTTKKYANLNISKEKNDWEVNSSFDESAPDNKDGNSSWDDEIPHKTVKGSESAKEKENTKGVNNFGDLKINSGGDIFKKEAEHFQFSQEISSISKNSISNFSFSENSFNSFEQDFSRNFLLNEPSFSNSAQFGDSRDLENCTIEERPFQSINKPSSTTIYNKSELYSPGHSDSDSSDAELHTKIEKTNKNSSNIMKDDLYDPLNSESEGSQKNMEVELSSIPLPSVADILLPEETKTENEDFTLSANINDSLGSIESKKEKTQKFMSDTLLTQQDKVKSTDFSSVQYDIFNPDDRISLKKQIINMKSLKKLKSKAASVFQDESDEEEVAEATDKIVRSNSAQNEIAEKSFNENKEVELKINLSEEKKQENKSGKSIENDHKIKRQESEDRDIVVKKNLNLEKKGRHSKTNDNTKPISPNLRRSKTPESKFSSVKLSQQEIKSDSFEIEPLDRVSNYKEEIETLQTIPVLTGLGISSTERSSWARSQLPGYTCSEFSDERLSMMDNSESFDIYPSEDSKYRDSVFDKDSLDPYGTVANNSNFEKFSQATEKSKKDRKKSRSRSFSPRKKRRSRSPERRRSPKRKNASHKYRNESPYSPRRRSPKRKSPSRWHRSSRSPDRRRKSRSRSPRKRRSSPYRRSRSFSPRKHRSPKRRGESPRRKESRRESPSKDLSFRESISPRKDYSHLYSDSPLHNRITVIRTPGEIDDMKLNSSTLRGSPTNFSRHLPDSNVTESNVNNNFYNRDYLNEFGAPNYPNEVGLNNLITLKNHEFEKGNSPERLSLDQRIELELGVPLNSGPQCQNDHYQMPNQTHFSDINPIHFSNSYNCDNNNSNNENFYQNQNVGVNTEFNSQFFNGHQQQSNYGSFQQFSNGQPIQNSVLQVGNIVEVVPTMQPSIPPANLTTKPHQIMQVGNILQVVPSQKSGQCSPRSLATSHNYGHSSNASPVPPVKTQKATAVVAPSSIVPPPNPEAIINPLIKAIQLEREKRKKEKEKRKAEREARRKARQLRREAKLMSVNEKLKKSVQDEGLMLGQEVEDDELLDALDLPTSPIPVEIITVSSPSTLPPAGKGILITAGFMQKPPSEKKEVKFADGVCPGEGTSTSGGEDIVSPPPKPKLPKEKRYKKKKTKVKKKVKVQIIRQIIQEEDDDDDDLSPPPPPPGDPPPVFFARFPFASNAQFPVYHTQQANTTTLTAVPYPAQAFQ